MNNYNKKLEFKIYGTHCASCEILIERKFRNIPGVQSVKVNFASGRAEIECDREVRLHEFHDAVKKHGYSVGVWSQENLPGSCSMEANYRNTPKDYLEIGAILLIVMAVYMIFKQFDLVPKLGISDGMGYGFVFLLGLVAAVSSCLAVTGGLLIALAAKYNETNPDASGAKRFVPHLYFNLGRIVSYTVLGGLVGALGSVLTFSAKVNGVITVIVSIVMILLGFRLLKIFPWLKRFQPGMPKFLAHGLYDASGSAKGGTAFMLGGGTFFLPCGFTQALQLYVLSSGDFLTGALTMLFFSLGTLPGLIALGTFSSFAKGSVQRYFIKFAGVLVLILGIWNVNNGLALTGTNLSVAAIFGAKDGGAVVAGGETNVKIVDGKQIAEMKVVGLSYSPANFTVVKGIPVEWVIDGTRAEGCGQVITIPNLGITEYLPGNSVKKINFTPDEVGELAFSCTMGMTTRGAAFTVVEDTGIVGGIADDLNAVEVSGTEFDKKSGGKIVGGVADDLDDVNEKSGGKTVECDPAVTSCTVQKLSMVITEENGFSPNQFTIKKNVPVELEIDTRIQMPGCFSTMVIPEYDVTHVLKLGKSKVAFTPTESGKFPFMCSMGILLGEFEVT